MAPGQTVARATVWLPAVTGAHGPGTIRARSGKAQAPWQPALGGPWRVPTGPLFWVLAFSPGLEAASSFTSSGLLARSGRHHPSQRAEASDRCPRLRSRSVSPGDGVTREAGALARGWTRARQMCRAHGGGLGPLARWQGRPQSPGAAGWARHGVPRAAEHGRPPAFALRVARASEGTPQTGREAPRGAGRGESGAGFARQLVDPIVRHPGPSLNAVIF